MNFLKKIFRVIMYKFTMKTIYNDLEAFKEIKKPFIDNQTLKKKESYKIGILIDKMPALSGGHTSILRLGTQLSKLDHQVYYITLDNSKKEDMERNAQINLPSYKGEFLEKEELNNFKFDLGISTYWKSCYQMLLSEYNFEYKVYFIQDFEPYFYPMGDAFLLASNTYKMGFHMISLGRWNKDIIKEFIGEDVDYIDFPVELEEYEIKRKTLEINKKIIIAAYVKLDSKRAPFLIIEQLKYLNKKMSDMGYEVEINVFGFDKIIKLANINNLGIITREEIKELYSRAHFGLVASLTNISLVNYEMIASGLPVIDLKEGSAPSFFSKEEMIFIDSFVSDLYNKVFYYVKNQKELHSIVNKSQKKLISEKISWKNSVKQFNEILKSSSDFSS